MKETYVAHKIVYSGVLLIDGYGCLRCDGDVLMDEICDDFRIGDNVLVHYCLSDERISADLSVKDLIMKTIGNEITGVPIDKLNFVLDAYDEYDVKEFNQELVIGGHDLIDELLDHEGQHLLLIIESV